MSDIKLPCKIEPWDGRVVDANDMYVDSDYVLLCVNEHERLVEALTWLASWAPQDMAEDAEHILAELGGDK